MPTQDAHLVTQHKNLRSLGCLRAHKERNQGTELTEDQVHQPQRHGHRSCRTRIGLASPHVSTVAEYREPTPAAAHVEVSADKAQAGARDVSVSFIAEAESATAGIVSLRVVLPAGIVPTDVTWLSGPPGWALTPAADGYTVGGPALPVSADAAYRVKIAELPTDATPVAFKTLQTYSDGHVDRWIEIPQPGDPEPPHPAPVLSLAPAAAAISTAPGPTLGPPTAPTLTTSIPTPDDRSWMWWWIGITVLVLTARAAAAVWSRRRTSHSGPVPRA